MTCRRDRKPAVPTPATGWQRRRAQGVCTKSATTSDYGQQRRLPLVVGKRGNRDMAHRGGLVVGMGFLIVIGLGIAAAEGYGGQTGADYFTSCSERQAAETESAGRLLQPKSVDQAESWLHCRPTTLRAVRDSGLMFVGPPKDDSERELEKVCPSSDRDIPKGGPYIQTLQLIEQAGGPRFVDWFLPAEFLIEKVWSDRWPQCSRERERQGRPKIVLRKTGGDADWERPCPTCK